MTSALAAARDSESGFMQRACPSVRLSVHLFVCLFMFVCRQNTKTRFSQKVSNIEPWSLLTPYKKSYMGFSKNQLLVPYNPKRRRSAMLDLAKMQKRDFLKKIRNLQPWCLLTTYRKSYVGFSKNPLLDP